MSNRIYIIGMGPGREEMMTGEAIAALEQVIPYMSNYWENVLQGKSC